MSRPIPRLVRDARHHADDEVVQMVLLRVLLDNDAVFSGMPIPELAAKCREFLVAHEFLRRDIADAATGQPVEMSPRKWESSWRKFPISIWMQEQEGRSWFAIHGDSLRVAFECDERLRGPCGRPARIQRGRHASERAADAPARVVRPRRPHDRRGVCQACPSQMSRSRCSADPQSLESQAKTLFLTYS